MAKRNTGPTQTKFFVRCIGDARTGKGTLAIEFARWNMNRFGKSDTYVIENDGREHEYKNAFGQAMLEPWPESTAAQDKFTTLDAEAVAKCIEDDMKKGEFKRCGALICDNSTNFFNASKNQHAGLKAKAMNRIATAWLLPQVPIFVIGHVHMAATEKNLSQKKKRESVSETEVSRMQNKFNLTIETVVDEKNWRFGIKVLEWRHKRDMQPFIIWDDPDNYFEGIFDKIEEALQSNPAPETDPNDHEAMLEYGLEKPFPGDKDTFKVNMGRICMAYYKEHDGHKFYAFGGGEFGVAPDAEITKKNGEQGANGAHNHFLNAYKKIAEGISGKKTYGVMSAATVQYVIEKIDTRIADYEAAKLETAEPEELSVDDSVPEEVTPDGSDPVVPELDDIPEQELLVQEETEPEFEL